MPYLTRDSSVQINYRVDGSGTTDLLLFNGATLPLEFWGSLATRLGEANRVIRFDQRNAGATRFTGTFSLNDVAADAEALLESVESEQVIVVGHAWGGRAAQVFTRDYPHRVKALVICATGGQIPARDTTEIDRQLRAARKDRDRDAWEVAFEARWCGEGFARRNPDTFRELADIGWNARANREARWDPRVSPSSSYWGTASVPVLLVYGEDDKNGTPENAADLEARLENAGLVMLPQAGHFVIREREDEVLSSITGFAQRV